MDAGEEGICEEYASSLEDLTFNSKPLINVLTMLAEENSQYAANITKLIEKRICQVPQQLKLPSLYLLDSIVKNVGGGYLKLVAEIMENSFTCVFEKADEKIRRDLYKLRHTWQQYFPAKMLHDLDVAVNKHDPGWPISPAPPPSPSIHINPKFLPKAEKTGAVLTASIATPQEHKVVVDHQQRLLELQRLQEEQLKLTELEIQEHQMKRDLLLKKQQQERKLLLQQQQQQILHMRLKPESTKDSLLSNGPPNVEVSESVSTKAETTEKLQETLSSRDPRIRRNEPEPDHIPEPECFGDSLETVPSSKIKSVQHMSVAANPLVSSSRVPSQTHLEREVTGSPKYGDLQKPSRPKSAHKRRNSGDWSSHSPNHENYKDEPEETHDVRGKARRGRRRSNERQRERGKGERGRGRGHEPGKRGREMEHEKTERRYNRVPDRGSRQTVITGRHDETNHPFRDGLRKRNEPFMPREEHVMNQEKWRRDPAEFPSVDERSRLGKHGSEGPPMRDRYVGKDFRGSKSPHYGRDEFVRMGSPGMHEERPRGNGCEREQYENVERFKPHQSSQGMLQDPDFQFREEVHGHPSVPFHDDPRDRPVGEPLSKKPRPLLSDVEITELRNRKGALPNTGRMTPPPVFHEGFLGEPMDIHSHPMDAEHPSPRDHSFGPPGPGIRREFRPHTPPMEQHPGEWTPGFEIPRELMLDHQNEIMRQAESRLRAGELTLEQHDDLVDKLRQLYELQRHPDSMLLPGENRPPPNSEHLPRRMMHSRLEEPPFRPSGPEGALDRPGTPPEIGPGRPIASRFDGPPEHLRIQTRGPAPMEPGHMMRVEDPRFEASKPEMRRFNDDYRRAPMEVDPTSLGRPIPMGGPPIRTERPFDNGPRLDGGLNPQFSHGRPVEEIARHPTSHENSLGSMVTPSTPPRQDKAQEVPHTPNTMMEKRSVDDLFRKLMDFGIIKVMPEPGSEPPQHVAAPALPQAEMQNQRPLPGLSVSLPGLSLPATAAKQTQPPKEEKHVIPPMKLVPEDLKKRHDSIIASLYDGTQCSSCGLRFPGEAAKIYREHLDWHFRKNRREKDGRRVAHRQWYFVVSDWLNYEEISDPDERAKSSFFDVTKGAADSPDPSKETDKELLADGSCPVLAGDTAECDICCEKFEQFWEEINEEWHYKSAVRIDDKTYHYLCYQDVKESQIQTEEDENEQEKDDENPEISVEEKSPGKDGAKTEKIDENDQAKAELGHEEGRDREPQIPQSKGASESNPQKPETDNSDSHFKACEGKGVVSLSSNVNENKENETKGDET